jgi:hypothetical protein
MVGRLLRSHDHSMSNLGMTVSEIVEPFFRGQCRTDSRLAPILAEFNEAIFSYRSFSTIAPLPKGECAT